MQTTHPAFLFLVLLVAIPSWSADPPSGGRAYIPVGKARTKQTVLAIPGIQAGYSEAERFELPRNLAETIQNDLRFMDAFRILDPAAFVEDTRAAGITTGTFKFTDWSSIATDFLVKSKVSVENGAIAFETHVYDIAGAREVFAKRYVGAVRDAKYVAHSFANDLVYALTGSSGVFLTKIAMACEVRRGSKELYIMDFDGTNVKQVTNHRSSIVGPAWHPDGSKIAYSVYVKRSNIKNLDLYEVDFNTNTMRMLSNRRGANTGAAYSPDGRTIAMTMSFLGNPEIFAFDPGNKKATRLTKTAGFDVDPTWSPDGKNIAFISTRSGPSMVWRMAIDGTETRRLTYAGTYNATPNYSPKGDKVVFSSQVDKHFDLFLMNSDGSNLERLTKNMGNNEDPFFSPDGNFIVFSSNRTGQPNIYVMNVDGTSIKRLTYGLGPCVSPKWQNSRK